MLRSDHWCYVIERAFTSKGMISRALTQTHTRKLVRHLLHFDKGHGDYILNPVRTLTAVYCVDGNAKMSHIIKRKRTRSA